MSKAEAAWGAATAHDEVDEKQPRRRREQASRAPEPKGPATPANLPGPRVRTNGALGSAGFYAPVPKGTETTTRQAEILTSAIVAQPTDNEGIAVGVDMLSGALVSHDPFTAYRKGIITSPATLLVGGVGKGKSSLLKTVYGLRALLLKNRRVVVIDKKARGDEGEYAEMVRVFGGTPIRLATDGSGVTLNPLDPNITGDGQAGTDAMSGARVLRALAEIAAGRELDEWEDQALRAAYTDTLAKKAKGRAPVLADITRLLGNADAILGSAATLDGTKDRYVQAGTAVAFMLDRLLSAYPNMLDGETSKSVSLQSKLTSFDVSALPEDGPAVPAVVGLANAWLLGQIQRDPGKLTEFVLDEGWHIIDGPNARLARSNTKLARALGLAMVVAIHKPADIKPGSPGLALIQEAETVHIFAQTRSVDAQAIVDMFELDEGSKELLLNMPAGQHLLKIGSRPEIHVRHVRSALEEQLTDTDAAMLAQAVAI